jgi:GAF domain-containing protein
MSSEETLSQVLTLACTELDMGMAFVSEVVDGHELVRVSVGGDDAGLGPGTSAPLDETICQRLLDGEIDGVVQDARGHPALKDLPAVETYGIGAYIGVPISVDSVRRYVLCCLALEQRPDLSGRDLRFLEGLAETVRAALSAEPVAG